MSVFGKLLKTGFDVVTLPVSVAKDVVTMGGACSSQIDREGEPYTFTKLRNIGKDADELRDELDDL